MHINLQTLQLIYRYYNIPKINARITFEVYNLLDALNEYVVNAQTGRSYSAILTESSSLSLEIIIHL